MPLFFREGDGGGAGSGSGGEGEGDPGKGGKEVTWESIVGAFTPEQKTAYDKHAASLKTPSEDERKARVDLEKQVADLSKAADEGSDLKKQLEDLSAQLTEQTARADFAEEAHRHGVTNPKLAYVAAKEYDAFDKKGQCDFAQLKEKCPELFAKQPKGDAGRGGAGGSAGNDIDQMIRHAAGRR